MEYANDYLNKAMEQKSTYHSGTISGAKANMPAIAPTIASAVGLIDSLNDRLMSIKQHLTGISDAIGGPRPVSASASDKAIPGGVVHRLNIGANDAHGHITDIEELIGAISRSLG